MDRIVVILPTWPVQTEALGDVMGAIGVITSSGGTDKRRRMEGGSAGDFMACSVNPVEQTPLQQHCQASGTMLYPFPAEDSIGGRPLTTK